MAACEKCWRDSHRALASDVSTEYCRLLAERTCTPEEQAGPDATACRWCDNRRTVHQHANVCMVCGRDGIARQQQGHVAIPEEVR